MVKFMDDEYVKLQIRTREFCSNSVSLSEEENRTLLKDLLRAMCIEEDSKKRNQLEQMVALVRHSSEINTTGYHFFLGNTAYDAYGSGDAVFAEFLFRRAYELSSESDIYSNNLAYVLRKSRNNPLNSNEIIMLLLPGVQKHDPFCLINMGLLFALSLSEPDDWRTADDLFSLLPNSLVGAEDWWEELGKKGDLEGWLVHFFLLRHEKIDHSDLGSIKSLAQRLAQHIDGFPDWLAKDYI